MNLILTTSGSLVARRDLNSRIKCEIRGVIYRLLSEKNNSNNHSEDGIAKIVLETSWCKLFQV